MEIDTLSDIHSSMFEPARGHSSPQVQTQGYRRKKLVRSCVLCHQRKIRCDKRSPCANCVKADVMCYYQNPQQKVRKPHKVTISDVAARVARLERTISAIANGTPGNSIEMVNESFESSLSKADDFDIMVKESPSSVEEMLVGGSDSSRYFNEVLLSRILAEEEELRTVLSTPSPASSDQHELHSASFDTGSILFGGRHTLDIQSYMPTRWQSLQLWNTFVTNVDPVIKILHIPTAQIDIYHAINNAGTASNDSKALLFSVFFAATTSLPSSAAADLLCQEKHVSLQTYKRGLEQALAGSNFLDAPSIKSLQALTLYITCLRPYNCGRASWALNGLIQRAAQSIGLHRDGRNFPHLTPFESEMRRRLWSHMHTTDLRAAEDLGISLASITSSSEPYSDIALPRNVNDSELDPGMASLPKSKIGWSEMTFCILMREAETLQQKIIPSGGSGRNGQGLTPEERTRMLEEHIERMEETYLRHCNENIPIQRITVKANRILKEKLRFMLQQALAREEQEQSQQPNIPHTSPVPDSTTTPKPDSPPPTPKAPIRLTDTSLLTAITILEANIEILSDELLTGFRWYLGSYFQYHMLTYVLWHLRVRPDTVYADRAWKIVDEVFKGKGTRLFEGDRRATGGKWAVMLGLRERAERARNGTVDDGKALRADEVAEAGSDLSDVGGDVGMDVGMSDINGESGGFADDIDMNMTSWGLGSLNSFGGSYGYGIGMADFGGFNGLPAEWEGLVEEVAENEE